MKKHFGLIGYPLGHTMSPFIQKKLFEISGVNADYTLFSFPKEEFPNYIADLKKLDGFNITIPHKQNIIEYLSSLDENAKNFGAVNTVKANSNGLEGFNTDAFGFLSALSFGGLSLKGNVLLYGYGGVARTIAFEALRCGVNLTFCTRNGMRDRAVPLANELEQKTGMRPEIIELNDINRNYDMFINATPVGMYPGVNESPLSPEQLSFMGSVFDTIYNPLETLLLKYTREKGIPCSNGLAMLVCQAAQSQEIWCGSRFSREQIKRVIELTSQELERK